MSRRTPLQAGGLHLAGLVALFCAAPGALGQLAFHEATRAAGLEQRHGCGMRPDDLCDMMAGAAVGDFDGDGWPDVFVLAGGRRPDRLFLNRRDGTFVDRAEAWGVARNHVGSGAAVGDFDGDGWLDLFVTSLGAPGAISAGRHLLYRNLAGAGFEEVGDEAGVRHSSAWIPDGFGAAFGDYDLDGDLDLAVTGWRAAPLSSEGNRLFRNQGDGTFRDVTGVAVQMPADTHGFSPAFADMDGDRFPELLIAADWGTSRYFVNARDGTFVETTLASGLGLDGNGMGATIADLDGDGRLDWYVTSIHLTEPFGNTPGDGNKLYRNLGGHRFEELARPLGVAEGGWGWGVVAADLDHDGRLDLVETNGFAPTGHAGPSRLWHQQRDGTFDEVALASGFLHRLDGRGLVDLDHDRDGDRDLLVLAHDDQLALFVNDQAGSDRHWLTVRLDTRSRPDLAPDGFGARVRATAAGRTQLRYLDGGSRYLTTAQPEAHFGLGSADLVERLEVEWPDGATTRLLDVPSDRTLRIAAPPRPLRDRSER